MEFLDITGNGGLGGLHPPLPQLFQQLILGLNVMLLNDGEDLSLSSGFHARILLSSLLLIIS